MNVGVFVPELHALVHGNTGPATVHEPQCAIRHRIGDLLTGDGTGTGRDLWWTLDSPTEELNCRTQLTDGLVEKVLPFFARLTSMKDVHAHLERQRGPYRRLVVGRLYVVAARHRMGDVEGALAELAEAKKRCGSWSDVVRAVERRLLSDRDR